MLGLFLDSNEPALAMHPGTGEVRAKRFEVICVSSLLRLLVFVKIMTDQFVVINLPRPRFMGSTQICHRKDPFSPLRRALKNPRSPKGRATYINVTSELFGSKPQIEATRILEPPLRIRPGRKNSPTYASFFLFLNCNLENIVTHSPLVSAGDSRGGGPL